MSLIRTNGRNQLRNMGFFPRISLFNDLFDSDFPALDWNNGFNENWVPSANVREKEKEYSIELSVPGYTKKDIHVEVDTNNILHISGKKEDEILDENEGYTRREFRKGTFERSFQLPETVNEEKINARCEDGILTVDLHKKKDAILKEKVKEIAVS